MAATGVLAVALLVPGVWAVAQRLAVRTPRLAAAGGWAMATGYVMGLTLSTELLTALSVASAGGDPAGYVAAVDGHTPAVLVAVYAVFGLGALGGGALLGVAMLQQRDVVPWWAGVSLLAAEPVRVVGLVVGLPVLPALASVLIAAGFWAVVVRVRRPRLSAEIA